MAVPTPNLFGWTLDTDLRQFYVFLALMVVLVAITDRLLRSRFGRAFMAIKDNEIAAAAMGIPTDRYIVLAFAWGGAVVGIGGAMFAISMGHLTPASFDLHRAAASVRNHHGRRSWRSDRHDHRRRHRNCRAASIHQLSRVRRAGIRTVDNSSDPVPVPVASPACWRAPIRSSSSATIVAEPPLLSVRNIEVRFGGLVAVDGVSFDLSAGEICALIGPNGAGKTTLFNAVSGNVVPNAGSIRFRGEEIAGLTPHEISAPRRTPHIPEWWVVLGTDRTGERAGWPACAGRQRVSWLAVRQPLGPCRSRRDTARARTAVPDGHRTSCGAEGWGAVWRASSGWWKLCAPWRPTHCCSC